MKIWEHKMTPGLVKGLSKMGIIIRENGKNDVNFSEISSGDSLAVGTNFHKLRYWGLIAHVLEGGNRVRGRWLLTRNGAKFLRGELAVPKTVSTWRNHIKSKSEELVFIDAIKGCSSEEFFQKEFPFTINDL